MNAPLSPASGEFKPRGGAILTTGILFALTGLMLCGTGLLTLVQAFAIGQLTQSDPKAMAELAGMQDMMWSASLINLVFYGGCGLLFLVVAYGCFASRRWSRPFVLTLGWGWLYTGVVMLLALAVTLPGLKGMMSQSMDKALEKSGGGAAAAPAMDGIFAVIMVIYFVTIALFLIALPALILWLQWHRDVRLTLESRDPVARWTDRQAAPLIGMTITAGLLAIMTVPGLFMMRVPWMAPFLPPGILKILWCLLPVVWAAVAWGSYRRHLSAWFLTILFLVIGTATGLSSMKGIDWAELYRSMGMPESEIETLATMMSGMFSPVKMGVLMSASMLPLLGFLIWVFKYFRRSGT